MARADTPRELGVLLPSDFPGWHYVDAADDRLVATAGGREGREGGRRSGQREGKYI